MAEQSPHWARHYMGLPWEKGAKGPHAYYCWSFFRMIQRTHFGVDVPEVSSQDGTNLLAAAREFRHNPARALWQEAVSPVEGDAVLMSSNNEPFHVGIWIDADGGRVLHCDQVSGVVATPPDLLKFNSWRILGYFHFVGEKTA